MQHARILLFRWFGIKQKPYAYLTQACLYSLENKVPVIAFSKDRCLSLFDHPHVDSMHTVYHEPKVLKDSCFSSRS